MLRPSDGRRLAPNRIASTRITIRYLSSTAMPSSSRYPQASHPRHETPVSFALHAYDPPGHFLPGRCLPLVPVTHDAFDVEGHQVQRRAGGRLPVALTILLLISVPIRRTWASGAGLGCGDEGVLGRLAQEQRRWQVGQ